MSVLKNASPFLPILLSLLCVSCIEEINMHVEGESPIIVFCVLTEDSEQNLSLYRVSRELNRDTLSVQAESVLLRTISFDKVFTDIIRIDTVAVFEQSSVYEWRTLFTPKYDTFYYLEIDLSDGEHISATTRFPHNLKVKLNHSKWMPIDEYTKTTMCSYEIFQYNWTYGSTTATPEYEANRTACNMWIYPNYDAFSFSSSDFVTDHTGVDKSNMSERTFSDFLYFRKDSLKRWNSWDERFSWEFFRTLYYAPDAPVYKGYLHIHHPGLYNNGLSQEELQNRTTFRSEREFTVTGDFAILQHRSLCDGRNYRWFFVSDEYDFYLQDVYERYLNQDNILSVYNTENIYTNIRGGIGVFGAQIQRVTNGFISK